MNQEIFGKLWIIVPVGPDDANHVIPFLDKHQWFLKGGGHLLLKFTRNMPATCLETVTHAGCEVIQQSDTGIYAAWNQAMDFLTDKQLDDDVCISFLGLDDQLTEKFCLTVSELLQTANFPDFIFGDAEYTLHNRIRYRASPEYPRLFGQDSFIFDIPHPGLMNKWATIRDARFDTRYRLAADFDFYVGIAQNKQVTYRRIPETQAIIGAEGMSNSLEALEIYPREWALIAQRRKVQLDTSRLKTTLLRTIARFPLIFHSLRRAAWFIRGSQSLPLKEQDS